MTTEPTGDLWSARCGESRTAGAGSGAEKRTGWKTGTALRADFHLCHRLGSERVFSVDIEPDLVDTARHRLAQIGCTPTLVAADGFAGLAEHAPFDRIVATCSVPAVPPAWVDQLAADGLLLVDLQPSIAAGNLVLLRRTPFGATGRFQPGWATFMGLRRSADPQRAPAMRDRSVATARASTVGFSLPWSETVWWFLAALALPPGIIYGRLGDDGIFLDSADGSWAEVRPDRIGGAEVISHGPTPLWTAIERAHEFWIAHGRPEWTRLGLSVHGRRQFVWLDDESNPVDCWTG